METVVENVARREGLSDAFSFLLPILFASALRNTAFVSISSKLLTVPSKVVGRCWFVNIKP